MKKLFWVLLIGLFMMAGQWVSHDLLLAQDANRTDDNCITVNTTAGYTVVQSDGICGSLTSECLYIAAAHEGDRYEWSILQGGELIDVTLEDARCLWVCPSELARNGLIRLQVVIYGTDATTGEEIVLYTDYVCLIRGEVDWLREYPG